MRQIRPEFGTNSHIFRASQISISVKLATNFGQIKHRNKSSVSVEIKTTFKLKLVVCLQDVSKNAS